MNELRIPKRAVEVMLSLTGVGERRMVVYLGEFAANHEGPEVVSDLVNGRDPFLPALDVEANRMSVIQTRSVLTIRIPVEHEPIDPFAPYSHEVSVTVIDGTELKGTLRYAMPDTYSRPVDYLNQSTEQFFPLLQGEHVVLINKSSVARLNIAQAK